MYKLENHIKEKYPQINFSEFSQNLMRECFTLGSKQREYELGKEGRLKEIKKDISIHTITPRTGEVTTKDFLI